MVEQQQQRLFHGSKVHCRVAMCGASGKAALLFDDLRHAQRHQQQRHQQQHHQYQQPPAHDGPAHPAAALPAAAAAAAADGGAAAAGAEQHLRAAPPPRDASTLLDDLMATNGSAIAGQLQAPRRTLQRGRTEQPEALGR